MRRVVGAVIEAGATVVDARLLPWVLGGLAGGNGVDIVERCALEQIEAGPGGWELTTSAGVATSGIVVDTTDGADATVGAGLEHGCFWQRRETLLTEPVQPFLRAGIRTATCAVSQTDQGEVEVYGRSGSALSQADRFPLADAAALAADATDVLPALARLRARRSPPPDGTGCAGWPARRRPDRRRGAAAPGRVRRAAGRRRPRRRRGVGPPAPAPPSDGVPRAVRAGPLGAGGQPCAPPPPGSRREASDGEAQRPGADPRSFSEMRPPC